MLNKIRKVGQQIGSASVFRVESRCTEETTSAIELLVNPLVGSFYPDVNRLGLKREEHDHDHSGLVSNQWSLIQFC